MLDFVALVDIPASEQIFFTDNGWLASGGFRDTEGIIEWMSPAGGVSAGTIIQIQSPGTGSFDVNLGMIYVTDSGFAPSTSGDQVFAYQGTTANPTFIFGFHNNGNGFEADSTSSNTLAQPPTLVLGTTTVAIPKVDNAAYNCAVTQGDQATLLAAIADASNWVGSNTRPDTGSPLATCPASFTVNPPTILISAVQGNGATSPLDGQTGTIEAIVTGDFQEDDADNLRHLNVFYIQEEDANTDGDASTSEGIFVSQGGSVVDVNVGDLVQVAGQFYESNGKRKKSLPAPLLWSDPDILFQIIL